MKDKLPSVRAINSNLFTMGYNLKFIEQKTDEAEEQKNRRHAHEQTRIESWLLKGGNNFFDSNLVLVPVNTPGHWTLAVIDNRNHTITYYDEKPKEVRGSLFSV